MSTHEDFRETIIQNRGDEIRALTATNDCAYWITVAGELFAWDRRRGFPSERGDNSTGEHSVDSADADEAAPSPQCLSPIGLNPVPHLMVATEDGEIGVYNGVYFGMYVVERQRVCHSTRGSCAATPNPDHSVMDEELVLREIFVTPCRLRDATHLSIAEDGTTAALSSPHELVIVNCAELAEAESRADVDPFDLVQDGAVSDMAAVLQTAILRVDCTEWFGQDVRGSSGCTLTCFLAPGRLAVLGVGNHLVSVTVDWVEQAVWLDRDGHVVVSHKHGITCMAAKRGVLALGCTNGTLHLLQSDSLTTFRVVEVAQDLERYFERAWVGESDKSELYDAKHWLRPLHRTASPPRRKDTLSDSREATVKGKKSSKASVEAKTMASHMANPTYCTVDRGASPPRGQGNPASFPPSILALAVGTKDVTVAFADLLVRVNRDTLAVEGDSVWWLVEGGLETLLTRAGDEQAAANLQVVCAAEGSWVAWSVQESALMYYVAPPSRWSEPDHDADDVIHAHGRLPPHWVRAADRLRQVSTTPAAAPPARSSKVPPGASKHAVITRNKPVTFGHQIKSSGYGQDIPWSVQQERKKAAAERAKRLAQKHRMGPVVGTGPAAYRRVSGRYEDHRYTQLSATNRTLAREAAVHRSAICSATFTASGEGLVTTSASGGYYLKLPVSKYKGDGVVFRHSTMHDGAVSLSTAATTFLSSSTNLSLHTPIVATGNADGVVHLWKPCNSQGSARRVSGRGFASYGSGALGGVNGNDALRAGEAPIVCHQLPQRKEVRSVRFFYLDKFLAYTVGAQLSFCPYWLDERRRDTTTAAMQLQDDLHRFKNDSVLGPSVFTYTTGAQHITSMDCVNHFASPLVVLASSNKSLTVLDIHAEAPLRVIKDAHKRAIHKVALASSSASRFAVDSGSGGSLTSQHLFASSGMDSAVTLWDLRQDKPVRQFALHKNVALSTIGLAFDPTASRLAVGSEDRSVYVYDTRVATSTLDVIKCGDVPSSIAFHPLEPVMAVGLVSGATMLYSQKVFFMAVAVKDM